MPVEPPCPCRDPRTPPSLGRGAGGIATLCFLLLLTACAQAPDWADPGALFDDDDGPPESRYVDPDAEIPNLSSVPDRPRPTNSNEDRAALIASLTADLKTGDEIIADAKPGTATQTASEGGALDSEEIVAVIYFGSGSSALGPNERQILADVAKLQQREGRPLKVIGHSSRGAVADDDTAAHDDNLRLSEMRAEEVARTLVSLGVTPSELFYSAAGDTAPLYAETTASGKAGNRRAEIFLESAPQAQ